MLFYPAWETLPFDRISPSKQIMGERIGILNMLLQNPTNTLIISTPSALMQKLPPKDIIRLSKDILRKGDRLSLEEFSKKLILWGYKRTECVREMGEFAIRGGIFDFSSPNSNNDSEGFRLDFFGNEIEDIRIFDLATQRTLSKVDSPLEIFAANETQLNPKTQSAFLKNYMMLSQGNTTDDPLFSSLSTGNDCPGKEHWMPLFYDYQTTTFWDFLPSQTITLINPGFNAYWNRKKAQYEEHYISRLEGLKVQSNYSKTPYFPVLVRDTILEEPLPFQNSLTPNLEEACTFDSIKDFLNAPQKSKVFISPLKSALERFKNICLEQGSFSFHEATSIHDIKTGVNLLQLNISKGFVFENYAFATEEDLLGERFGKPSITKKKKAEEVLMEASSLSAGDYIVHDDHGVGRFLGLQMLPVLQTQHDCLALEYANNDKLYVPVENIAKLTRYGGSDTTLELDKLGSHQWSLKKARAKKRIQEIAHSLIALEAERMGREGIVYQPSSHYDLFAAAFPYAETDDQLHAIEDVFEDLASGKIMDRLICGDVGYGKTEVAMRAAFLIAESGKQVALLCPTTLLCRQHFKNMSERLSPFGIKVKQLSRLVTPKESKETLQELEDGKVDIVVATHALLSNKLKFKDLGLVIIDEEQHFGVKQKEKLKELANNVHLLTLSATPIPRTLHMALSGLRSMSIIATPPIDRVAVRTFVLPFDPVVIKEALLREYYRGGQSFYVCPRIEDLEPVLETLHEILPQLKIAVANGQMKASDLDHVMNDFCDGKYHILLATNIIESGIDVPSANTIIIHNANLFGLSQLYQLRGRVGRSKVRAYAYLTTPHLKKGEVFTEKAIKRLEIMTTLDALGAGFRIASHDMDIRGVGNLVGSEQSGHIKEIGVELYQQLLKEAIEEGVTHNTIEEDWSSEISVNIPVYIPDTYVKDLSLRMTLYRRLGAIQNIESLNDIKSEFIDRFGSLPEPVDNLLSIIDLKLTLTQAGFERCDIGPKACVLKLRKDKPKDFDKTMSWINDSKGIIKLKPDGKIQILGTWKDEKSSLKLIQKHCKKLSETSLKSL